MEIKNRTNGVTLIVLTITIVILLILAGIVLYYGKDTIKMAQIEELKTNMLLIQAKAREYVEDANFKMGINPDEEKKANVRNEVYITNAKLKKVEEGEVPSDFGITDITTCYWLTPEAQSSWGLDKIKLVENEKYLIQFDENNVTVEIYNTQGYEGNYSLTAIENNV
ncbi:MAG: type II secretion system protein [Clostridia bacterium]|nr:type II secretion system protein [Clostridia bacterium]